MKIRSVVCVLGFLGCLLLSNYTQVFAKEIIYVDSRNPYLATSSRYNYLYANPPRQRLYATGRYIASTGKVRYLHSPSRLKGAKHAARINAYNYTYSH